MYLAYYKISQSSAKGKMTLDKRDHRRLTRAKKQDRRATVPQIAASYHVWAKPGYVSSVKSIVLDMG